MKWGPIYEALYSVTRMTYDTIQRHAVNKAEHVGMRCIHLLYVYDYIFWMLPFVLTAPTAPLHHGWTGG